MDAATFLVKSTPGLLTDGGEEESKESKENKESNGNATFSKTTELKFKYNNNFYRLINKNLKKYF